MTADMSLILRIAGAFLVLALLPFAPGANAPFQKVAAAESSAYWPSDP